MNWQQQYLHLVFRYSYLIHQCIEKLNIGSLHNFVTYEQVKWKHLYSYIQLTCLEHCIASSYPASWMKLQGINFINMLAFTNKSVEHILRVPAHSLECESQISKRFTNKVQYNKYTGQEQGGYTVLMVEFAFFLLVPCLPTG